MECKKDNVSGLRKGTDGIVRCAWSGDSECYIRYHDLEWGRPVASDHRLFEKLALEGFQAGLSWLTILKKREAFREAFAGFDPEKLIHYGEREVALLLGNPAIVRHRGKIEATIHNAGRVLEVVERFGSFAAYVWEFEPACGPDGAVDSSLRFAKDLKRRGFRFVGPTTAYAFMQAMGLVNDHLEGCASKEDVVQARLGFQPPKRRRPSPEAPREP
ncbi:MAG: DNA-3-methyladenine glycosylase I [Myxococcota bacterium]